MQRTPKILAWALLATQLALPLAAQDQSAAENTDASETVEASLVVATVNGVDITLGHMIVAMATLPDQYQQLDDQTLFDGILNQLVQQEALSQVFDQTLPARVVYSLENEKRSLVAAEVVENAMNVPLDEDRISEIYDQQYGGIEADDEYNASHILVENEEEAIAIKEELDGGANFAQTARERSVGPSGPNGGDLGWFSSGMMVPDFEAATIALEPGEISDPVQTQFGWHVIQLKDVRKSQVPTLTEVRPEIETQVRREIADARIQAAADQAEVVVKTPEDMDASAIRRIDLLQ
ncbi:MAG: peptidylprolyl isomerase [Pseudomonadota bacterium]